jgi:hypothetical protein
LEYVRQHGSARNIALTGTIGGFKLGTWVNAQRTTRMKGKLEVDRERRLQEVPGWTWNTIESQWDEALSNLGAYIKEYGSARVPQSHTTEDGFRLGQWAQNRRRQYARGALEADRAQQLESLPGWTWDPHADQWEESFSQLLKFIEETGTARVPKPKRGANALELWAQRQRSSRAKGELDPERERRLQELPGWTWHALADQWEEGFSRLEKYVAVNGDARILQSSSVDGYALGRWVSKQRVKRRQGALESDRVERLERLPGWSWDAVAELWEEGYRRLTEYVQRNGHSRVPNDYAVDGYDLGNWVNIQRGLHLRKGKLEPERARRLEELPGWTWDARAEWWEEGYRRLREFVESKGDACIPSSYTVDGYRLGAWVNSQRGRYAKGILDADRQSRLEALQGWRWNALAAQWEEGFRRLQSFVEQNGHARVPQSYTDEGYRLGSWVAKQHAKHAEGGLEADRQRRLQDLPGWTWDSGTSDRWEEGYRQLLRYVEQRGDARVVRSYTIDGFQLGTWVKLQRRTHTLGALQADRADRLQNLPGWTWDPLAAEWEEGFSRLLHYVEQHGDARVPQSYAIDGYKVGAWVGSQRQKHAKGILDADRRRRLEDLPGWTWDPFAAQWEEGFQRLVEYLDRHGHVRVPLPYVVDGYRLGTWVNKQRGLYSKGSLDTKRKRRLQDLQGWTWDPLAAQWQEGFQRLVEYVDRYGDARVPYKYQINGFKLGGWVCTQRSKYTKGTLDDIRRGRLEELVGWLWKASPS